VREYELATTWGLPKQSWLVTRHERERFGRMLRKWKRENPKATLIQEMLAESLVRLHIWEQRLVDRRTFFDGERTDYQEVADHKPDVDTEDLERKMKEWKELMPLVIKWKTELLKLALANGVNLQITGDARNVSALFGALDQSEREKVNSYRGSSGENAQETD